MPAACGRGRGGRNRRRSSNTRAIPLPARHECYEGWQRGKKKEKETTGVTPKNRHVSLRRTNRMGDGGKRNHQAERGGPLILNWEDKFIPRLATSQAGLGPSDRRVPKVHSTWGKGGAGVGGRTRLLINQDAWNVSKTKGTLPGGKNTGRAKVYHSTIRTIEKPHCSKSPSKDKRESYVGLVLEPV